MSICHVSELPADKAKYWKRAGIVLYKLVGTVPTGGVGIRLAFGIDRESGDISNFAGKPLKYADKNILDTAVREFEEESLGVFDRVNKAQLQDSVVIYNDNEIIIFYRMNFNEKEIQAKFARVATSSSEMKKIYFCNVEELIDSMAPSKNGSTAPIMYDRVRDLIAGTGR